MPLKRVLCAQRLRVVPAQFSWVDHRLVRHGHLRRCDAHAAALYLFLVTVADAQGLSYYSDQAIGTHLSMPASRVMQARADLLRARLIAWSPPLYQVLALDEPAGASAAQREPTVRQPQDIVIERTDTGAATAVLDIEELRRRSRQLRLSLERPRRDRL